MGWWVPPKTEADVRILLQSIGSVLLDGRNLNSAERKWLGDLLMRLAYAEASEKELFPKKNRGKKAQTRGEDLYTLQLVSEQRDLGKNKTEAVKIVAEGRGIDPGRIWEALKRCEIMLGLE